MSELWQFSASELLAGYADGQFTPLDAARACLGRIAECQPQLNAFVHVDHAGALTAATDSSRRWARREPCGLLDGVPVSLKDNLDAAGLPTTWGSRLLHGYHAPADELPVARLRASGAVLLGKTNLPEFAMSGYTDNLVTGVSRNPWDPRLTPGGSSGGAAAAVAAGCGPLAVATDGGGSIRRPASHCGLVGFKPSAGVVPRAGGLPDIFLGHEVVGCLARSMADAWLQWRVMAGAMAGSTGNPAAATPLRILYVPRFDEQPVDAGIAAAVRRAAGQFAGLGHSVEEADRFDLAGPINDCWSVLSCAGLAWLLNDPHQWSRLALAGAQAPDPNLCMPGIQAALGAGLAGRATDLFDVMARVQVLVRRLQTEVFSRCDVMLTPATACLPWAADQSHPHSIDGKPVGPRGHAVFTALANAAGLPALALPSGIVNGLPTGVQLVGPPATDASLLALGLQFEQAHPWTRLAASADCVSDPP